jgi:hypothetical protein
MSSDMNDKLASDGLPRGDAKSTRLERRREQEAALEAAVTDMNSAIDKYNKANP